MKKNLIIGLVVGALASTAYPALSAWFTSVTGSAGGSIGTVEGLEVEAVYGGDGALPGDDLPLKATVVNGNQKLSLKVVKLGVTAFDTSKDDCAPKGRFTPADNLVFAPGKSENVTIGVLHLSPSLDEACAGAKITARLAVKTTWVAPS